MCLLKVEVSENKKEYQIHINNKEISLLKDMVCETLKDNNYIVVISKKVHSLYGKILNFPKERTFILKDGEKEKNFKNYEKIMDFALRCKLKRNDAIIAIGGGVVGDISGFVASTYMRGIKYIQIPTTLLACTDSSVGGKTAINTKYGKNLIGAFYQPDEVFINVNFLKTLDKRQYNSGLGEVLKYAFIEKSCQCEEPINLMNFLSENYTKVLNKDTLTLLELIKMCVKLKISVVNKDEKENGLRRILNYGHTYAHALETFTNYRKYTHGECVAYGILFAINLAYTLGKIDKEYKFLCEDILSKYGYTEMPKYDKNKIISIMDEDKKSTHKGIHYILADSYASVQEEMLTTEQIKVLTGI